MKLHARGVPSLGDFHLNIKTGKLGYVFVLMMVLVSAFVVADVSISEPLNVYSLGDKLRIDVDGLVGTENGNLNINLVCANQSTSLVKIPARAFSDQEAQSYSVPYKILSIEDLEVVSLNQVLGECQVVASLGAGIASTKTFTISSDVIITASLDKSSYDPGETVSVDIEAVKANGVLLNGFVEGAGNITNFDKAIEDGYANEVFSMPETIEARSYALAIRAYDTDRGGVLNEGSVILYFNINQIASSIIMSLSDVEAVPGGNFTIGTEVFDQSGIKMDGTVSIELISPDGEVIESSVPNNEFASIDFVSNSTAGTWKIIASFNELSEAREFEMVGVQDIELDFEDSVLTVTNVGNVLYNKSLTIDIGGEVMELDLKIDIGESRKFSVNAPNGEYKVIIGDGDNSITRKVLLTGNAISVSDLKNVGIFRGYSIVWIFLIVILGGVGFVFFSRYRKTKTVGKDGVIHGLAKKDKGIMKGLARGVGNMTHRVSKRVPGNVKSHVGNSMNFTNKSPKVQGLDHDDSHEDKTMIDLTKKRVMSAESTLVLKGEKYVSSIVSLSVKNHGELSKVAKEALEKIIYGAEKKKGLVDEKGDYIFIVFSPLITKTYKNETLAVNEGMRILNGLNEYNKKFKDKIEFNLGVHVGELITSKGKGKLQYTSIGNTVSLAKRISDSGSKKVIVSDEIRKKLLRDLKVSKGKEVGGNQTYEVNEVKNRAEDRAKLDDLLKRAS